MNSASKHWKLGVALVGLISAGCVWDRTGESASEVYQRELALQGARTQNLELQFGGIDSRVGHIEELSRSRGQSEILNMENLDQLRRELANLRGEMEVLRHEYEQTSLDEFGRAQDTNFRLMWLDSRVEQIEKSLGLEPPAPPTSEEVAGNTGDGAAEPTDAGAEGVAQPSGDDAGSGGDATPNIGAGVADPNALIKLAEKHLSDGREAAAEAVLERYLDNHAGHEREAEGLYRYAEAAFNAGQFPTAVIRFQKVIDDFGKSNWAAWAMLRQGECFEEQKQAANARLFYEDVVRMWPKSDAAKEARAKLK